MSDESDPTDEDEVLICDEVWAAAMDPSIPPGVVRIDGRPYPLIEFVEDEPGA